MLIGSDAPIRSLCAPRSTGPADGRMSNFLSCSSTFPSKLVTSSW
jgi:hypothetical protein